MADLELRESGTALIKLYCPSLFDLTQWRIFRDTAPILPPQAPGSKPEIAYLFAGKRHWHQEEGRCV